eukprot:4307323-Pleurochrysis_carterae.AAC.2
MDSCMRRKGDGACGHLACAWRQQCSCAVMVGWQKPEEPLRLKVCGAARCAETQRRRQEHSLRMAARTVRVMSTAWGRLYRRAGGYAYPTQEIAGTCTSDTRRQRRDGGARARWRRGMQRGKCWGCGWLPKAHRRRRRSEAVSRLGSASSSRCDMLGSWLTGPSSTHLMAESQYLCHLSVGEAVSVEVPPVLGYGAKGKPPTIQPNSTLHFDLEIVEIVESAGSPISHHID